MIIGVIIDGGRAQQTTRYFGAEITHSHQKENTMHLKKSSLIIFAMLLIGTATFTGGCATTGMDRSVKASNSIRDVDSEIRKMIVQIDITAASLDSLVLPGQTDLKKPFDKYSDDLAKLDSEGKKVLKRTDELKARSKEYFEEWEKQGDAFTNPEIRELSTERRTKLAEIYSRVPEAGYGIKGTYHAYLTDLKEIQKYLSTDLTPKGVEAITPVAKKSVQDLQALKISLQPLLAALDEIKAELYSKKK
jgi:predicted nuclease with TOPRIM domain